MADSSDIFVLIGPTASGKSAVAFELAQRIGGDILAVDSMTVYRGLDIGTAKPTSAERAAVPHYLIDIADPTDKFSVAQFVAQADAVIADARRRRVPLVATGGTPMYFKALFEGLFEGPGADPALRATLEAEPTGVLHERLLKIDPEAAQRIHANDTRRLARALEVHTLTGQPITTLQQQWAAGPKRHAARWFGLNWEKEALNRRINARVKMMIAAGWPDEVRTLIAAHGELGLTAAGATGYRELIDVAAGRMTLDDAVEQIKVATRQLARRQMKWFRRFESVTWMNGERETDEIVEDMIARTS